MDDPTPSADVLHSLIQDYAFARGEAGGNDDEIEALQEAVGTLTDLLTPEARAQAHAAFLARWDLNLLHEGEDDSAGQPTAVCRFHPQAWLHDQPFDVDPEGPTDWTVPKARTENVQDNRAESDELRFEGDAPSWIRNWAGPFWVEILPADG